MPTHIVNSILEDKDILQIDATIITGILILLTLSNIAGDTSHIKGLVGYVAYTVIPFSISAVLMIILNLDKMLNPISNRTERKITVFLALTYTSLSFMILGFCTFISILIIYFLRPNLFGT